MNEEKSIKGVLTIVLFLIIVAMAFTIYDLARNDSAVIDSISNAVMSEKESEEEVVEEVSAPKKPAYIPPAPEPIKAPAPTPSILEPGMMIVTYTDSGFIPPVINVNAGDSVTFINSSSKPLWITGGENLVEDAEFYRGFDQGKSMSTGGTYVFSFTKVGVWGYKNLNQESHLGAISVIPQ